MTDIYFNLDSEQDFINFYDFFNLNADFEISSVTIQIGDIERFKNRNNFNLPYNLKYLNLIFRYWVVGSGKDELDNILNNIRIPFGCSVTSNWKL